MVPSHKPFDDHNRPQAAAMQSLLKMLSFSNAPTVAVAEDDVAAEPDEPPDDQPSALHQISKTSQFSKASRIPAGPRRESLLTRAIMSDSHPEDLIGTANPNISRGLSTASSHSAASMASTAELTSDASPTRSCTPSPPLPTGFAHMPSGKVGPTQIVVAPVIREETPAPPEGGEAAVEKTLGRKRCIMFACGGSTTPELKEEKKVEAPVHVEPPKRKCALTFICPSRQEPAKDVSAVLPKQRQTRPSSPLAKRTVMPPPKLQVDPPKPAQPTTPLSPQRFHEFGSSHEEDDSWVNEVSQHPRKLTLTDCMKKENAIRKLGEEAEEEAEQEEREADEAMEDDDDQPQDDDFAPSDDGNESDDEGGFAESDDESDAGSDYQFWAPTALSTTTAATSTENLSHISTRGRSRTSSLESLGHSDGIQRSADRPIFGRKHPKGSRMRPSTPELPDSTDFVCGTLDEDRPLEAAYKSCIEQRKRQKHVPIPQDIDPSFPTTDPEDEEDDEEDENDSPGASGPMWLKDQFADFDVSGRSKTPTAIKSATPPSPRNEYPFPRPQTSRRPTKTKSPPPPPRRARSPPPRHLLFRRGEDSPPRRMRSPAPTRLRSPPASPNNAPATGFRIDLAQRPLASRGHRRERTSSLPRTPNPFFKHFNVGSPSISNVASGAVTPAIEEPPRADLHVRGPVDIVMGLERKRQKRKEKFWRQHCRKAAKEHAERKTVPGRGAERMRELGLECAERNRGYGLPGPGTQLVISL